MADTDKPNVEFHDPAKRPSQDDQGSGPAERAVFGTMGIGGMVRFALTIAIFIVVGGTVFYVLKG